MPVDDPDTLRKRWFLGRKNYELADHLGNVLAVVLDRKTGYGLASGNYVGYSADLASVTDYYPFGMPMPGRNFEATEYRFGQGTQMKSDEVYGDGSLYTALFWEYDARLGRRWNRDPITYPWQSSYAAFDNSPIVKTDPLGLYGTKSEAEKMQGRAKTAGYQTGEVYENGKEWGFNYTDEKGDNTTTFSQTNFSNGGKRYDGRYMKPVSAYRWRRGNMPEKERDDEAFIKYGEGGNSFSRWWKTVKRDWYAPENSEVTQDIDDVAPAVMAQAPILGGMGAGGRGISSIVSKNLRAQKQVEEHILGGFRLGTNSYFKNVDDAIEVLNAAHNGDAAILSINASQNRIYVEYSKVIGYYNNNGVIIETNKFLIKGGKSATIVPIHPKATTFK